MDECHSKRGTTSTNVYVRNTINYDVRILVRVLVNLYNVDTSVFRVHHTFGSQEHHSELLQLSTIPWAVKTISWTLR